MFRFETLTLAEDVIGNSRDFLIEGCMVELLKFNGNPIGLELPPFVELAVAFTEPGVKGDSSSGTVTKPAKLETGLEIRVPLFIKEGEKIRVSTEAREFAGRARSICRGSAGAAFRFPVSPTSRSCPASVF